GITGLDLAHLAPEPRLVERAPAREQRPDLLCDIDEMRIEPAPALPPRRIDRLVRATHGGVHLEQLRNRDHARQHRHTLRAQTARPSRAVPALVDAADALGDALVEAESPHDRLAAPRAGLDQLGGESASIADEPCREPQPLGPRPAGRR